MDEGYIKFEAQLEAGPPLPESALSDIQHWRQEMFRHQLIGAYENGIGYGNISCRYGAGNSFIISGTATGNFPVLDASHYTLVHKVNPSANQLWCRGPIMASSESMSHSAIYQHCPEIKGVIHIHDLSMWGRLLHRVPTTDANAPYGSPEMVASIIDLLENTPLRQTRVFVMEGHREGVFAFGENLKETANLLLTI